MLFLTYLKFLHYLDVQSRKTSVLQMFAATQQIYIEKCRNIVLLAVQLIHNPTHVFHLFFRGCAPILRRTPPCFSSFSVFFTVVHFHVQRFLSSLQPHSGPNPSFSKCEASATSYSFRLSAACLNFSGFKEASGRPAN